MRQELHGEVGGRHTRLQNPREEVPTSAPPGQRRLILRDGSVGASWSHPPPLLTLWVLTQLLEAPQVGNSPTDTLPDASAALARLDLEQQHRGRRLRDAPIRQGRGRTTQGRSRQPVRGPGRRFARVGGPEGLQCLALGEEGVLLAAVGPGEIRERELLLYGVEVGEAPRS